MNAPRKIVGWMFALTAASLNKVSHRMLHMAMWLMDHDALAKDCPNCMTGREQ